MNELSDNYVSGVESYWDERNIAQREWLLSHTPCSTWVDPVDIALQNPSLFQGMRSFEIENLAKTMEGPLLCYVYVDGLRIKRKP